MKKVLSITAIALLGSSIAFAAGTNKQGKMPHAHIHKMASSSAHELPRSLHNLNLSEAQKTKIQSILAEKGNKPAVVNKQERVEMMQKFREQEQQLLNQSKFDEQAARRLINERQQAMVKNLQEHQEWQLDALKRRHAIMQVLTPEQQKQLAQQQTQRHQKMSTRGKGSQTRRSR